VSATRDVLESERAHAEQKHGIGCTFSIIPVQLDLSSGAIIDLWANLDEDENPEASE